MRRSLERQVGLKQRALARLCVAIVSQVVVMPMVHSRHFKNDYQEYIVGITQNEFSAIDLSCQTYGQV